MHELSQPLAVSLLDFALSLSEMMDWASPLLAQHQLRTAYIAGRLAKEARFSAAELEQVVLAALLHDIGALSVEDKLRIHEDDPMVDLETHCSYGEQVLSRTASFRATGGIVRYHHTPWQDRDRVESPAVRRLAQTLCLADTLERQIDRQRYILHQDDHLRKRVVAQSGVQFDPELIEVFQSLARREEFWLDSISPRLTAKLRELSPKEQLVGIDEFLGLSEMIRLIIDFRSRFTATHSAGVAVSSSLLAGKMGFREADMGLMRFAGNLHDIGKLSVPNSILEKPAALTRGEFAVIRQHTYHTCNFMLSCGLPVQIMEWAAFHHERLDGNGYPFHCAGDAISMGSRILAVADVLTALAEDRPYRSGMTRQETLAIINRLARNGKLDRGVCAVLEDSYDDIIEPAIDRQKRTARQFVEEVEHGSSQT